MQQTYTDTNGKPCTITLVKCEVFLKNQVIGDEMDLN